VRLEAGGSSETLVYTFNNIWCMNPDQHLRSNT